MRRNVLSTMRIRWVAKRAVCICALLYPVAALAQNIQYTQNVADTTLRSRFRVDPSTLGLSLQIPLANYPGRGGAQLPISLYYSAKVWNVNYVETKTDVNDHPIYNTLEPAYGQHSVAGWTCSLTAPTIEWTGYIGETYDTGVSNSCEPPPTTRPCEYISRIRVYLPDGSSHEMRKDDLARNFRQQPLDRTGTFLAVDGSRLRFESSSNTLFLPDGSRYLFASPSDNINEQTATQYIDRNGNTLVYNSGLRQWTDSMGRIIGVPLPVDPALGGGAGNYDYDADRPAVGDYFYDVPGVDGTTLRYTLRWKRMSNVLTLPGQALSHRADHSTANFNPSLAAPNLFVTSPGGLGAETGDDGSGAAGNGVGNRLVSTDELFNPVVLSEVVLPNSVSYKFTYNIYGEIDKVIYPTGGYERYTHARIAGTSYLKPIYGQANRGVVDQYVSSDGVSESHWQYSSTYSSTDLTSTVSVTAPDSSRTERLLHGSLPAGSIRYGFDDARVGMAYQEKTFSASGQMLRRTLTKWITDGPTPGGDASATRNPRVAKQVQILLDTTGNALTRTTFYAYDQDLNVSSTTESDFVAVPLTNAQTDSISTFGAGSPMRTVDTTYLVNDTSLASSVRNAYRARQLIALPTIVVTRNGLGTRVAETRMNYDESTYSLLSYSGVTGWIDPLTTNRGNPTTVKHWLDTTDTFLETHTQYDYPGNPRNSWDALGNQSQIEYSSAANAYAYPTLVKTPVPDPSGNNGSTSVLQTINVFDFATGLLSSTTDPNGQTTNYAYADALNRLTSVVRPAGGGSTTISYNDVAGSFYVRTQTQLDAARLTDSYQYFDGLGRQSRSFVSEGSAYIVSDTQYDSMLRVLRTSNPYRTTLRTDAIPANVEWTTSLYDALGRVITVTTPDGAVVSTSFSLNQVIVTDQAQKVRRSTTDALGRLTTVVEDPAGLNYQTTYGYDALDNLKTVTQGTQPARTFAYDSLKRLVQAFNPESGTVNYTYNANSNLVTKIDARNITATYGYDALNRVISRSYSGEAVATPAVTYKYDGTGVTGGVVYSKGKLTLVSSTVSAYSYDEYDQNGRVKRCTQTTGGQPYQMSYGYDLAGNMTSETYPSGKVIATEYDAAGRIGGVKRQANGMYYAGGPVGSSAIQFAAHGAVASMRLGSGRIERTTFNNRLQPVQISLDSNSVGVNTLQLDYGYGTTTNNGNVLSQTITVPKSAGGNLVLTQGYSYDALNRLATANENNGTSWSQTYGYDQYGNRWVSASSGYALSSLTPNSAGAFNASNNRLVMGASHYDPAGNLDVDVQNRTFSYDGENRQIKFNSATQNYFYDGDGRRVKKIVGNDTTVFVYNVAGQLIAEYTSATPAAGDTSYLTTDHLGSTRLVTDSGGNVKARYDYLPFGEEIPSSVGSRSTVVGYGGADSTKQKFTQKERDNESGLDYFGERYYSSAQGRFTSCDPLGMTIRPSDPQTMNRFVFVLNNPLRYVDPDGLAEKNPWDRLTDEERRVLASRLTTVGNAKKPTKAELTAAGNAFNQLINRPEQIGGRGIEVAPSARQVSERIAAVQNFIDLAGGHGGHGGEGSAVWQQIQGINNVWEGGMIEVVVKDRGDFTKALESEGYAVNAWWDIGPHDNDSARQLSDTSLEPGLHFANDDSNRLTTYWAHVDQRSANFSRTTYGSRAGEMYDAARSHDRPSIPSQIRQFLKIKGIAPKSER